jgi:hypothetical protein
LSIIREIFKEGEISIKNIKHKKALEVIGIVKTQAVDLEDIKTFDDLKQIKIYR